MKSDVVIMLKQIVILDLIVGAVSGLLIKMFFGSYVSVFLLGLAVATIGFIISSFALNNTILDKVTKLGVLASIINFAKVFIICIIGILIFNNNINNVISYILGFTSHFIALFFYGILNLYNERK